MVQKLKPQKQYKIIIVDRNVGVINNIRKMYIYIYMLFETGLTERNKNKQQIV